MSFHPTRWTLPLFESSSAGRNVASVTSSRFKLLAYSAAFSRSSFAVQASTIHSWEQVEYEFSQQAVGRLDVHDGAVGKGPGQGVGDVDPHLVGRGARDHGAGHLHAGRIIGKEANMEDQLINEIIRSATMM